jgi:MHS family proline/betaine transporter-like MFS transporter
MAGNSSAAAAKRRPVVFGAIGTTLEWFDFTLYLYLSPIIAALFFPSGDQLASLMATFGVFAAGYLMRPLGALFFGSYGDRRGRKAALSLSVAMMSGPMVLIGLLPTHATIGAAAAVLLVLLRLVQGFSVGGEFGGSIVLLEESAPPGRRGLFTNLALSTAGIGFLLSSLTATVLHALLSTGQMESWGWRLPFFLGAAIGVFAFVMRRRMDETERFKEAKESGTLAEAPVHTLLQTERGRLMAVFLLVGYSGLTYYLAATFVPSWLQTVVEADPAEALLAATVGALLYTVVSPFAGLLSDRIGRRPMMAAGAVALAVGAYPLFDLMSEGTFPSILIGAVVLMLLVIVFAGPSTPTFTELFSTATRYSGVAVGYGLGMAVFGGTAPLLATGLIKWTGNDLAPSFLLVGASLLILAVIALIPETAFGDREKAETGKAGGDPVAAGSSAGS